MEEEEGESKEIATLFTRLARALKKVKSETHVATKTWDKSTFIGDVFGMITHTLISFP